MEYAKHFRGNRVHRMTIVKAMFSVWAGYVNCNSVTDASTIPRASSAYVKLFKRVLSFATHAAFTSRHLIIVTMALHAFRGRACFRRVHTAHRTPNATATVAPASPVDARCRYLKVNKS
jgi:hypothetical protein